jgi:hypothetical protein
MELTWKSWGRLAISIAVFYLPAALHAQSAKPAAKAPASGLMMPKMRVDPAWPQPMPNGWTLGQVASAASDPQTGHIWIIQRPRTVRPWEKPAPPVMEFDEAGKYVQGWGGPENAKGYTWPRTEHGIYIDYKGFVWVGGSGNDDQIMKFTKNGTFVLQIGHPRPKKSNQDTDQFWKPTDVFVYQPTNELFVSDGYGNKRVIVFDADTGAYKRMWGAFGKPPLDSDTPSGGGEEGGAVKTVDPKRIPAKDLPATDQGSAQFDTVHGIKLSKDGMVYVADRGGKRVQVFTIDGKYINQVFVDRFCESPGGTNLMCGNGQTSASVALSGDREQRFLYVASRSPSRVVVFDRKTLTYLTEFGQMGVRPGEFYGLHHMTTDEKGNLYTSEVEDGRRVQKFVYEGMEPVK